MAEPSVPVRETALLFGAGKSLVAVISDPPVGAAGRGGPAVVLLNAGLLHRVGPNRLYVKLARRLASAGFVVARFDLSGVGDSAPAIGPAGFEERAVAETKACLDLLEASRGARTFILGGVCSGADNALRVAREDPRIVGVALMEPVSAPSAGHVLYSYRERLLSWRSWLRLVSGRSEVWTALAEVMTARSARRHGAPPPAAGPPPERPGRQMRCFADGGGALCLVYSAASPAYHHYRTALRRDLEGVGPGRVRVEVVAHTDHVFTPLEAQGRLLDVLCEWTEGVALARRPLA